MPNRTTSVRSAVIALVLILGLICTTAVVLKKLFAPSVTKANAQMVFDAFGAALRKGDVVVSNAKFAEELAREGFRKQTDSPPLDGWAHEMRITAKVDKDSCTLVITSAGGDNVFNTADDVVCEQTFDISRKSVTTGPTTGLSQQ